MQNFTITSLPDPRWENLGSHNSVAEQHQCVILMKKYSLLVVTFIHYMNLTCVVWENIDMYPMEYHWKFYDSEWRLTIKNIFLKVNIITLKIQFIIC